MAAPKIKPADLTRLYSEEKDQNLQDKKLIESLKRRLNEKLSDPQVARKAALILASWINQKKR